MQSNSSTNTTNQINQRVNTNNSNVQQIQEEIRKARADGDEKRVKILKENLKKFVINE